MFKTAISSLFACTLFLSFAGCGGSESQVMIEPDQATDIQAQRDARDAKALEKDESN